MEYIYNFNSKCPTVHDFETYLQNSGDANFSLAFKSHIEECEICNEAILGYQNEDIRNISNLLQKPLKQIYLKAGKSSLTIFKTISYAASIIIFLGVSSLLYFNQNQQVINYQALGFDYSMLYETQPLKNKTLSQKSTEQFIYISNCNKIAYNDQYLSPDMLNEALKEQKNTTLIRIEVGNDNYDCTNKIINSIKNNQSVPVLTIKN